MESVLIILSLFTMITLLYRTEKMSNDTKDEYVASLIETIEIQKEMIEIQNEKNDELKKLVKAFDDMNNTADDLIREQEELINLYKKQEKYYLN